LQTSTRVLYLEARSRWSSMFALQILISNSPSPAWWVWFQIPPTRFFQVIRYSILEIDNSAPTLTFPYTPSHGSALTHDSFSTTDMTKDTSVEQRHLVTFSSGSSSLVQWSVDHLFRTGAKFYLKLLKEQHQFAPRKNSESVNAHKTSL
jgi:hypothetical protein